MLPGGILRPAVPAPGGLEWHSGLSLPPPPPHPQAAGGASSGRAVPCIAPMGVEPTATLSAGSASAWTATQGPRAGRVSRALGGQEGDRVLMGSGEWHECHHLSAMPVVSAWPLLDKVWTFQPLDRGWDSAYSQPKSGRHGLKLQRVETPWAGLGDPVWVGAHTAPRHPFLTLHVRTRA